jgi:hypothetical protein
MVAPASGASLNGGCAGGESHADSKSAAESVKISFLFIAGPDMVC